eukprot:1547271-Amphidinium_carterae.1
MIKQSYIQYHPTSGYHKATDELKDIFDHQSVIDNWYDELSPLSVRPKEEENGIRPCDETDDDSIILARKGVLRQDVLFQDLRHVSKQASDDAAIRKQEMKVRAVEIHELYIILSAKVLRQWITTGTIPPNSFENGTDEKHGHYNFHIVNRIKYAIGDFVNVYLHDYPDEYPQHEDQVHGQAFCLTIVHTTTSSLKELTTYPKEDPNRRAEWFL